MKARLETINDIDYLSFKICLKGKYLLTQLPVITKGKRGESNKWSWNGSLDRPSLKPSIRTKYTDSKGMMTEIHYWLIDGVCHCLNDCKDGNQNKKIELLDYNKKGYNV